MASPSVAYITSTVYRQTFFYGVQAAKDLGSGFIINANGEILTNLSRHQRQPAGRSHVARSRANIKRPSWSGTAS